MSTRRGDPASPVLPSALRTLGSAVLLVTALAGCTANPNGGPGGTIGSSSTSTSASTAPTGPSSTAAAPGTTGSTTTRPSDAERTTRVYFVRDEKVAVTGRPVPVRTPANGAIEALLAGPSAAEARAGMSSAIPDGVRLLGINIGGSVATVDLSGAFAAGGGSQSMQARVAQVVFTLTQFPSVGKVTFHLDGKPVDAIGGEGVPAVDLTRADFTNVTPLILVESPLPDQTVRSPFTLSGISNTFEATVRYSLTDPDGTVLVDSFTTATAGSGTWGTFEATISSTTTKSGTFIVRAFEDSPEDGRPINIYTVTVRVG